VLITDALLGEHAILYAHFDRLEEVVPTLTDAAIIHLLGGSLAAELVTHAGLENDLLFAAMEEAGAGYGPVVVMRHDHDEIEGLLETLPQVGDATAAADQLLQCIERAREHFSKEEQVLFPMARQVLGEQALQSLAGEWANRRRVVAL